MIDISILVALPKSFLDIKEFIQKEYSSENINIEFISIEDKDLEEKVKNSDLKLFVVDKSVGALTSELLDENFFTTFKKEEKVNINNTSKDELQELVKVKKLKKSIENSDEFSSDIELTQNIKEFLDSKIEEITKQNSKVELDSTFLEAIKIDDYFSIKDMELENLGDKKEIYIVGENGDGKTILLQAILLALKNRENYSILAEKYISPIKNSMKISTKDTHFTDLYLENKNIKNLFAYGINRNKINNKESVDGKGYSALFDTPTMNRTTYLREPETILSQKSNVVEQFIVEVQKLLGDRLKIIKDENNNILFQEQEDSKPIDFDMLSEGYKTTIIWLSDLLSRLMENQPEVTLLSNYKAIVLIDEVDLYLHPKWKYDFMYKLRKIFPNIQFIVTTHSMVTVLGASEDAVFYKIYKENGITKVTNQIDDISHYTANILITSPLFNLDSVKVRGFDKDEKLSSDDHIYREIHSEVREYMKDNPSVIDEDVRAKVKDKLKERLAKLRKR